MGVEVVCSKAVVLGDEWLYDKYGLECSSTTVRLTIFAVVVWVAAEDEKDSADIEVVSAVVFGIVSVVNIGIVSVVVIDIVSAVVFGNVSAVVFDIVSVVSGIVPAVVIGIISVVVLDDDVFNDELVRAISDDFPEITEDNRLFVSTVGEKLCFSSSSSSIDSRIEVLGVFDTIED